VVGVLVAVHDVRHRLGRHLRNRRQVLGAQGGQRIDNDHAVVGDGEHRVVGAVGEKVDATADLLDDIALRAGRRAGARACADAQADHPNKSSQTVLEAMARR
jgi:hypothetical protein